MLPSGMSQIIKQAKFTCFLLRKAFEKQIEKKKIDALKSLKLPNKIDQLKKIESIFPKNQLNDLNIQQKEKNVIILVDTLYLLLF